MNHQSQAILITLASVGISCLISFLVYKLLYPKKDKEYGIYYSARKWSTIVTCLGLTSSSITISIYGARAFNFIAILIGSVIYGVITFAVVLTLSYLKTLLKPNKSKHHGNTKDNFFKSSIKDSPMESLITCMLKAYGDIFSDARYSNQISPFVGTVEAAVCGMMIYTKTQGLPNTEFLSIFLNKARGHIEYYKTISMKDMCYMASSILGIFQGSTGEMELFFAKSVDSLNLDSNIFKKYPIEPEEFETFKAIVNVSALRILGSMYKNDN